MVTLVYGLPGSGKKPEPPQNQAQPTTAPLVAPNDNNAESITHRKADSND